MTKPYLCFIINKRIYAKLYKEVAMKYICELCGYEYDSKVGDTENGIEAGTDFEDIPEDWTCPLCGATKEDFEPVADDSEDEEDSEM